MNGLGNEIVIVDVRQGASPFGADEARAAARQERYDQLMALYPGRDGSDASIRIYNSDGSEAGACGNGMRCVGWLLSQAVGRDRFKVETRAGVLDTFVKDRMAITVDMGEPKFGWQDIPLAEE